MNERDKSTGEPRGSEKAARAPDRRLKTTYLGNYMEPTVTEIVGALEEAGIEYWSKNEPPGLPFGEFGYRIFVDKDRLDEARLIGDRVHTQSLRRQALEIDESPLEEAEEEDDEET